MPGSVSDPIQPGANSGLGRVRSTKQIVHITDYAAEPAYLQRDPFAVRVVEELGIRTNLSVPMLQDNELVGAFSIYRTTVKPFSEKQIELIAGFAAQAVIAIENARLLNELRQRTSDLTERTADLTEALDHQTATSEVLQVISNSPGDLEPTFQAMLENATRLSSVWCSALTATSFTLRRRSVRRPNWPNTIGRGPGPNHYQAVISIA
jgi:GAF domain-containing protein